MQPINYGQAFYQSGLNLPVSTPASHHGFQYSDQQFYQQDVYADFVQHASPMTSIAIHSQDFHDRNETKPRLAKQEVDLLERHFQENHKPPSSLKRQLAENMGVQVCRINNWFQNRRAKAKHEAKQAVRLLKLEHSQSDGASPEEYDFSEDFPQMFEEDLQPKSEEQSQSGTTSPQSSAPFNPMYEDPAAASIQSLQRTELESQAAYERGDFDYEFVNQVEEDQFGSPLYNDLSSMDHTPFPASVSANMVDYEGHAFATTQSAMDTLDRQATMIPMPISQNFSFMSPQRSSHATLDTFPSQLLADGQAHGGFDTIPNELSDIPRITEPSSEDAAMRFMSPPPSIDIASRRSKRRPAPIGTDAIGERSSGARTPLTAAPPRRTTKSPGTGIRRVSSVGAGLNVLGSRVTKSIAPPLQSPLRQHFPHELKKFAGMNSQVNLIHSSSGLAPPTPRSPNERAQFYADEECRYFSNAPDQEHYQHNTSRNNSIGYSDHLDLGFSPPETPGHMSGGYHWAGYDVADNALHTPGLGSFPTDPFALQMPQPVRVPQYVSASNAMESGTSQGQRSLIDVYQAQMQMSQQYLSPRNSELSVSPLSSCNVTFNNPRFESCSTEVKPHIQYQWGQHGSEYAHSSSAHSSPEQPRNQTLIFHNATPRDFEGKTSSGSP